MSRKLMILICCVLCQCLLSGAFPPVCAASEGSAAVTVYFPNWSVYSDAYGQVKDLPWDRLDCINHAFWKIEPSEKGFMIVSTDPWADTDASNPKAHFPQYAKYAEIYPHVSILLSVGGWTDCGYFSQMALTPESRPV